MEMCWNLEDCISGVGCVELVMISRVIGFSDDFLWVYYWIVLDIFFGGVG